MKLKDLLQTGQPIITDGATGTMLFQMGLQHGDSPELWNVEQPEKIHDLHRGYVEAGSQILLTNTFGANRLRLQLHNLEDRVDELNRAAVRIAREEAAKASHPVLVAGDIGPTGSILLPYGDMEFETAVEVFEEQVRALVDAGADFINIETMSDLEEVRAAVTAVRNVSEDIELTITMTFDTNGRTMMGVKPEVAIETLQQYNPVAIGGNCGNGTAEIEGVIQKMHETAPDIPLIAKSNAGIPKLINGVAVYDSTPEDMAAHARTVHANGAMIIGACCGSTPEHIRAIRAALTQEVSG